MGETERREGGVMRALGMGSEGNIRGIIKAKEIVGGL